MSYNWEGKTILIAEDESDSRLILKVYLKKTLATIYTVENGQEAIDFCSSNQNVDIILMDISMPVKCGLVASKEIKEFNANIIIIAQTALASKDFMRKCKDAGCDNYVPKPIKRLELLDLMSRYLGTDQL